ncbi:MAG: hypothetical protein ACK5IP_02605 [Paracoccus sp. (in: a-proteobacteria)]
MVAALRTAGFFGACDFAAATDLADPDVDFAEDLFAGPAVSPLLAAGEADFRAAAALTLVPDAAAFPALSAAPADCPASAAFATAEPAGFAAARRRDPTSPVSSFFTFSFSGFAEVASLPRRRDILVPDPSRLLAIRSTPP